MAAHRVVVLGISPVIGYDLTIPVQVLAQARDARGDRLYDVAVVSADGEPLQTVHGYAVLPGADVSALDRADTVIVPGTDSLPRREGRLDPEVRAAIDRVPPGARWVSICTGAFVLGAAGLLDGHRVTTHWKYGADLARLVPGADVDVDVLFVDDGDVLTSAGLSAGVDLCLHLIRSDHGHEVANAVARHMVVPPWRDGGQAQFIDRAVPAASGDSTAPARDWALAHLADPLDVTRLARQAAMSPRTFTRRFRAETGQSPAAWIAQQRLRHAQHLLEVTDLTVDDVALRSGLGTGATLRTRLREAAGVSPSDYRRAFRAAPERSA